MRSRFKTGETSGKALQKGKNVQRHCADRVRWVSCGISWKRSLKQAKEKELAGFIRELVFQKSHSFQVHDSPDPSFKMLCCVCFAEIKVMVHGCAKRAASSSDDEGTSKRGAFRPLRLSVVL